MATTKRKDLYMMGGARIDSGQILLGSSMIILMVSVAMPMLMVFINTFFYKGSFDLNLIGRIVLNPANAEAILNTLKVSFSVTVIGTILGVFFAWLSGRSNIPLKKTMKALFMVPYMFPPFIGAMAWALLLGGRSGYLNKFFMEITGGRTPLFNINSLAGIIFVEICYYFPFVFMQVSSALERMDPTLEEAARIAGVGQLYVIRKITLPLVKPAIAAGAMLILISSISHFGVPAILGFSRNIFVLPTKIYKLIYASAGSFEGIREGAALSIVLVFFVLLALALQRRVLQGGHFEVIHGKSMRPALVNLRQFKYPLLLVSIAFLAFVTLLPLLMIFTSAFLKVVGLPITISNMTVDNFKELSHSKMVRDAVLNSAFLSISAATIVMLVGTMIAYVIVKVETKGKRLLGILKGVLEILSVLPYSIPGIVLAVGVILTWSGAFKVNLYNTIWIILIAYLARYMAFAMKSASASLEQVHNSLEEAARSCGSTYWETLRDITLPLIKPGMIAGFLLVFLPAMRELTTSLLLYGPFTRTLGVAIYSVYEEGNTAQACGLAAIAITIIMLGQLALMFITRERKGR